MKIAKSARTLLILLTFCLTLSSLAWAGYTVSPGDTVDMQVVAHDNLNTKQQVAPDGTVSFPLAGRLTVQGKSLAELDTLLQTAYLPYIENPQVVVSVTPAPVKPAPKKAEESPIYVVIHDKAAKTVEVKQVKTAQEAKAWMIAGTPIEPIIANPKPGDILQVEVGAPKQLPVYVVIHDRSKDTLDVKTCETTEEAKALTGQETIKPGDTIRIETGKEENWWDDNWYKVLTGAGIVVGLFNSLR